MVSSVKWYAKKFVQDESSQASLQFKMQNKRRKQTKSDFF